MEELLEKTLESFKEVLKSKEMLCACYAYDYENNKTSESLEKFNQLWTSFSFEERKKVIFCFYSLNNYEMLRKLNDKDELGKVHQKMMLFMKVNI